jgi:hypothetical protein
MQYLWLGAHIVLGTPTGVIATNILYDPQEFNFYYNSSNLINVDCPRYLNEKPAVIFEDTTRRTATFRRYYFLTGGHFYHHDSYTLPLYLDVNSSTLRVTPLDVFGQYGTRQLFHIGFAIPSFFVINATSPSLPSSPSYFFLINTVFQKFTYL